MTILYSCIGSEAQIFVAGQYLDGVGFLNVVNHDALWPNDCIWIVPNTEDADEEAQ